MTATLAVATERDIIVASLRDMARADHGLTGLDLRDIAIFVDEDAECDGHETGLDAAGALAYCNGSCVPYFGPAADLVMALIVATDRLHESAMDVMQSVEIALGW